MGVAVPPVVQTLSPLCGPRVELWAALQGRQLAELREVVDALRAEAEELERAVGRPMGSRDELVALVDAALQVAVAGFDDAIQAVASAATARLSEAARQARWELVDAGAAAELVERTVPALDVPVLRRPRPLAELLAGAAWSHPSSNPESPT